MPEYSRTRNAFSDKMKSLIYSSQHEDRPVRDPYWIQSGSAMPSDDVLGYRGKFLLYRDLQNSNSNQARHY